MAGLTADLAGGVSGRTRRRRGAPALSLGSMLRWRRRRADSSAADAASTLLQLAVLLQAGVAPARAWAHLASTGDHAAAAVVLATENGMPLAEAIATVPGAAWNDVAAAWRVASVVGAPLAGCLRGLASALRDAQEAADDVRIALAEPAGTARLMGWLPIVAVGLGAALGFDTVTALLANPLGLACLAGGVSLIFVARRWTTRLVARAREAPGMPGLDAELVAIALSGGVSIDRARAVVHDARAGATGDAAGASEDEVTAVLALSRAAGVPAVELLRASAAHARHRARVDGRLRAARLSSRLLLPLGVCTLPAFLLLGVAPMLLSVMSTMSISP